jgi:hypothetical protein
MPRKRAKSEPDEQTKILLCRLAVKLFERDIERIKHEAGLTDEDIPRHDEQLEQFMDQMCRETEECDRVLAEFSAQAEAAALDVYRASLGIVSPQPPARLAPPPRPH